jgi:hypothetical protein
MANTLIQLKYSTATDKPAKLNIAEPAYSYTSNTLFIGTPDSLGTINIGGLFYTSQIDNATNLATPSTIVKRDASGNAVFNGITANSITATISGNASTATRLQTARDIGLAGDATGNVSFDGSSNVTLTVDLTDTGVGAGTYGGSANIPYFTVDVEGRLTAAGNTAISTNLSFSGNTGTGSINLLTDTLGVKGQDGISTTANDVTNTITVNVDNTVLRTTGTQSINGDLTINGNIVLNGNTFTQNVTTLTVSDPMIYLAANNYTADTLDIGFAGNYYNGASNLHAGVIRVHGTNDFYMFTGYNEEFDGNLLNIANPTLTLANTHTNVTGGRVSGLSQAINVADGGTGNTSFTLGKILVGNGTGAIQVLANTGTAGTYGNAATVPVVTTDAYGRVSGVTNTAIAIDTSAITSGTLGFSRGGTGATSYTTGGLIVSDGSKLVTIANNTYTQTGTLTTANTVTAISIDDYGRTTALTAAPIAISADQVTSGTLPVGRGGTGATSFTLNGVLLGNNGSALQTASSSTEGHILTINASGVPTFSMLSGGTF